MTVRERAARVVAAVADRLTVPAAVAAVTDAPANAMYLPGGGSQSPWHPVSLTDGYPAMALLFAELAAADPAYREVCHRHLSTTLSASAPGTPPQLFIGAGALAFATQAAARGYGGYATLLERLDASIVPRVRRRAEDDLAAVRDGAPIGAWDGYDVVTGASGVGRYLLTRPGDGARAALRAVLTTLVAVALADDVEVDGVPVPAWWVRHGMTSAPDDSSGHLNVGLAHGVCGPLALLAVAWRDGVRVDGQEAAVARLVGLLETHRAADGAGPLWPMTLDTAGLRDGRTVQRHREAWCYGAAGIGRALYLAGAALDEKEWRDGAYAALDAVLAVTGPQTLHDFSLCHGWAGLLHVFGRTAEDSGEPRFAAAADALAERVVGGFDPDSPFGYRYAHPSLEIGVERPGFLEGAAGIALALHSYAISGAPATGWDAALLLD